MVKIQSYHDVYDGSLKAVRPHGASLGSAGKSAI
jgi:hypothetical protein